ncbi:MAG TPA: LytTR family DNA-binding domain-containing protein [Chitinophagaceae bacterium]|jgi:DNA-binding LytR/AlgR family response regulator|nr:LytTR family DNA-binding domain-containing protein [Chitinophagaceae bacterium]
MIRAVIIEDERLIATELCRKLTSLSPPVEVKTILSSVQESIDYFLGNGHVDLIFSDIQLPDGLSFEIFERISLEIPVVFVTGFDSFIMNAFEHNGIDYLLKPVDENDLIKVLEKYKNLEKHFAYSKGFIKCLEKRKERLVVKKGFTNVLLRLADIVLFYTENKIVYVFDKEGRKYVCDQNLSDLQNELDDHNFFRANRQYIININYIRGYKAHEKVKLALDLTCNELNHFIVISQETASHFRKWITES